MLKTVGAVIAGFVAWTVLFLGSNSVISTAFPDAFNADGSTDSAAMLLLVFALSVIFSVISGWITAKLASLMAYKASLALGVLLLAVGLFVQLQYWDVMPLWYHLLFLGALVPGVLLGYRIEGDRQPATASGW